MSAAETPASSPALLSLLQYELPDDRVARYPTSARDGARLLRVTRGSRDDRRMLDLPDLLSPGDLLVMNDTRVVPARLFGHRETGGRVELLVLPTTREGEVVDAMLRPGRRLREGERVALEGGGEAWLRTRGDGGLWKVELLPGLDAALQACGHMPLPPYLGRGDEPLDRERYQTIVAGPPGAVAAPTAGLHFSRALLDSLQQVGVRLATVTLHVGPGTFRPLREDDLARGRLHEEPWTLPADTAAAIDRVRAEGGRVVAVGTTSTRVLESAAIGGGRVRPGAGTTDLFLRPGSSFSVVDRLVTNLHLPGSSLLALVAAWAGVPRVRAAYAHAIAHGYRFYSYGDAMLLDLDPPRTGASDAAASGASGSAPGPTGSSDA